MKNLILCSIAFLFLFVSACGSSDDIICEPCVGTPQEDCVCYEIYAPVCGCNDVTYDNDCLAECAGVMDYTQGPCPK